MIVYVGGAVALLVVLALIVKFVAGGRGSAPAPIVKRGPAPAVATSGGAGAPASIVPRARLPSDQANADSGVRFGDAHGAGDRARVQALRSIHATGTTVARGAPSQRRPGVATALAPCLHTSWSWPRVQRLVRPARDARAEAGSDTPRALGAAVDGSTASFFACGATQRVCH
jgi:hypothetical protein